MFKIPQRFYQAFIEDTVRLYRIMPKRFHKYFWAIQFLQIILAITESASILVLSFFGASMASPEFTKKSFFVETIFKYFPSISELCTDNRIYVAFICLVVVFFIIFKNFLSYLSMVKSAKFAENFSAYISDATLKRYLNKSYFWHISPESGSVIQRLNLRGSLSGLMISLMQFYSNIICSIMLFITLFIARPELTIIVVIVFTLVGLITYFSVRKSVDRAGEGVTNASIKESTAMMAALRGVREVLIYRQQEKFLKNISCAVEEGRKPRAFLGMAGLLPAWFLEVAGFSTIFGVLVSMVYKDALMPEIIESISMLMLTAWRVLPAVSRSLNLAVTIRGQRPMALSCLSLLETFVKEPEEPVAEPDSNFKFNRSLALKDVFFSYPQATNEALKNINLKIKKGEVVGLIGHSGAGKSSLAMILSGLMPLKKGEFLIDGKVLTPGERAAYCQKVGFVSQTPFLINGSVADNVAFSQWGENYNREQVKIACKKAAMDFIFTHPQGIDLQLTQDGSGLSGGQAQRVSIARALFNNPEVIIFDEATSSLDQTNENIIMSTVEKLGKDTTVIIIAHRLSTVEKCDRIIWVDEGTIVSEGIPKKIIAKYNEKSKANLQEKIK